MITNRTSRKEDAISPVIGVMLMLVVTVVVAAVVTAYAGGLSSMKKTTPPSVTIEGTYSQANGMTITHKSGDPVALSQVEFRTTPSELFGPDADKFTWPIDKTIIRSSNGDPVVFPLTGFYNTSSFVVGDTLTINAANCTDYASTTDINQTPWAKSYGLYKGSWAVLTSNPGVNANARVNWGLDTPTKAQYFANYAFGNPANVGKYFYLDLVDPSGNRINRAKVTITA